MLTQPWPAGPADGRRDQVRYCPYTGDRARQPLKGVDEQISKAEQAVAEQAAVKHNRFDKLTDATKSVNQDLEAKVRALAGIKGYVTNLDQPTPDSVIDAYHQLFQVEKSFRMVNSDLAARPNFPRTKDSIAAHLTIVFASLTVSRWIENTTGWSIKKFVTTLPRYRTVQIQAGDHVITADPPPDDAQRVLDAIRAQTGAH